MKIYITGIAGMLGYNLYQTLKDRARITGTDLIAVDIAGLSYQKISLFDRDLIEKHIEEIRPDVLIHTAALVNVDECEEEPAYARRLNTEVTAQLAEICRRHAVRMVYISTDAVFDGRDETLYTEEDAANPVNVYGRTKLDGEAAVLRYPEHLVLRTNIYGRNIQKKQSFGEWIYHALKRDETLKLFTDIDFSPILVTELAELIYKMCQNNLCGLYHACGTGCMTKYAFGVKLKEIFRIKSGTILPAECSAAHLKAERSRHMGMSNQKLTAALGTAIRTPEESIEEFYRLMEGTK